MMTRNRLTALFLGGALFCVPALGLSQSTTTPAPSQDSGAKQDMKNAGTSTKNAAKDAGNGVKTGTKKAYHATKTGTKKAWSKTKSTTKGAVNGTKQGAEQPAPASTTPQK
jgi:hypothetical protein